jgi:hypothetical protein
MPGHADKKPKRWECGEERVVVGATCRMRLQRSARTPIEGRQGYLSALAPSTIDWPALTSGLGDT